MPTISQRLPLQSGSAGLPARGESGGGRLYTERPLHALEALGQSSCRLPFCWPKEASPTFDQHFQWLFHVIYQGQPFFQ